MHAEELGQSPGLRKQVSSHCLNGFAPDCTRGGLAHSPPISSSFDCKVKAMFAFVALA